MILGFAVQRTTAVPQALLSDIIKILESYFLVDFGKEYKNFYFLCILFWYIFYLSMSGQSFYTLKGKSTEILLKEYENW